MVGLEFGCGLIKERLMSLSDADFRRLLGEHVTDQRAEQALRDDRQELLNDIEIERVKVSDEVWNLEYQLLRERTK